MVDNSVNLGQTDVMPRKQIGMRLEADLIEKLKKEAKRRNRSVTNLVETILKKELDLL